MLAKSDPDQARKYFEQAQLDVETRWRLYQYLAARPLNGAVGVPPGRATEGGSDASEESKSDPGGGAPPPEAEGASAVALQPREKP
jgi:pyruvate-ferredoxin/flavodoxin oxidoreductase